MAPTIRRASLVAIALVATGCDSGGDTTTIIKQEPTIPTATQPDQATGQNAKLGVDSPITTQGLGPVLAGMTQEQAEQAAGLQLTFESGEDPACSYATTPALSDVSFMFVRGELARVDVRNPQIATLSGIRVGATESEVLAEYGASIDSERNEYVPKGRYLMFVPESDTDPTRIVFETDGRSVTYIRAGRLPEVGYIEGCA